MTAVDAPARGEASTRMATGRLVNSPLPGPRRRTGHWANGERSAGALHAAMRAVLDAEPRARTEYVSVVGPAMFRELDNVRGAAMLSMAVFLGRPRLIDNLVLEP